MVPQVRFKPRFNSIMTARLALALCFSEACTRVNAARLLLIKARLGGVSREAIATFEVGLVREEKRLERLRKAMSPGRDREAA